MSNFRTRAAVMPNPCAKKAKLVDDLLEGRSTPKKEPTRYTDVENIIWWKSLTTFKQRKIFEKLIKASTGPSKAFICSINNAWGKGYGHLTEKQIAAVRRMSEATK